MRKKESLVLWSKQPIDSDESFEAFIKYRDSKPPRKLFRAGAGTTDQLSTWYRDHSWKDRVAAYDAHLDSIRLEEREALIAQKEAEITAEHLGLLADARELVARELQKYLESSKESIAHGLIKPSDLIKLMDCTVRLERLTRGESTEKFEIDQDLSGLSLEELRMVQGLVERKNQS